MACHKVRNVKHDEWKKFGETLQEDFQHNQKKFWAKIRGKRKGNNEVEELVDRCCVRRKRSGKGEKTTVYHCYRGHEYNK